MTPKVFWQDILSSLSLLSRLPLPAHEGRGAASAWAYSVAGIVLGSIVALVGAVCLTLGLPLPAAATIALLVSIMQTGGLHEDGLADMADGLWGGQTPERRLDIMKDSHIGSYGVIALVLGLIARWSAFSILLSVPDGPWGILAAECLSRAAMPFVMSLLPNARENGLSRSLGHVDLGHAGAGLVIALVVTLFCTGMLPMLAALLIGAAAAAVVGLISRAKIGGQTGDVLGGTQQIVLIALLFTFVGFTN